MRGALLSIAVLSIFATALAPAAMAQQTLHFGVLAKRGNDVAQEQWGPLADYLSGELGRPVKLLPLSFQAVEPGVANGKVDLILANPGFHVGLEARHGVKAVATMKNRRQQRALSEFAGVILVKNGSPITTLEQLRGTSFMCVSQTSFGGGQMAFRHLLENGIDPFVDLDLREGGKHDAVVMAVRQGAVQAGTVRSDTLERMAAEGQVELAEFQVIDAKWDDGFPFAHSTRTYPEWPMSVSAGLDPAVARAVASALMALAEDHPAAVAGRIVGWGEPADYAPVAECLRTVAEAQRAAR
mgnify:CR=1 FL=1